MQFKRRDALKVFGGATLATLVDPAFAKAKPQRVLILGGTGFIGPHFVNALKDGGHSLTLFNRGKRDPDADPGIEQLIGDRNGQIDALKGRDWDAVIDNSAYTPKQTRLTADLLKGHVRQYILISSVAAYANFAKDGIDESYELMKLDDPTIEEVNGQTYGGLKALCEKVAEEVYGKQATLIRPTYIAGPGDYTDRFTYWPVRVSKGGEMLVPGTPSDPFQIIDVRDLADFMRLVVEKHLTGAFNLCNPPRSVTMGSVLDTSKRVTGADTKFTWATPEFLEAQGLIGKDLFAPSGFPLWTPTNSAYWAMPLISPARAIKKGLKFRSLETTIRDTLGWQATRPAENQTLGTGLKPEQEAAALAKLHT
jgi:2'-hydroxyisoflavone reductase